MGWFHQVLCNLRWAVVVCTVVLAGPGAEAAEYQIAPSPPWVTQRILDSSTRPASGQTTDGVFYLLVDQQAQLLPSGRTTFRRIAVQALNGRGLELASHINVSFDPTYQALTLHALNVHRDGHVQDRLQSTSIKVLQRESDLEYRMYDGSKTVDIVLSDIRPGDVVEYAYSIRGTNPMLLGKESGRVDMQWGVSVHHLYRRLLTPAGQELSFRSHLGDFQSQVSVRNGWKEYNWAATDITPITRERDAPRWYDAYPYIEWTSFKDWGAVARWAAPMYVVPKEMGAPLQREIDRIVSAQSSPELRLAAVLEFVQSQIRYLGIEIGQGSYQPRSPKTVFHNRYGDCKDKVFLAVAMLRAMDIKAAPALVDTTRRHMIGDFLPSPNAFNHVILKAQIGEVDYWLDPTRRPQKGQLHRLAQANFGKALVVDGQTSDLTTMRATQASEYRRSVDMHIDASKGYAQPATLTISTAYEGASADDMRDTVRNDDLTDLQRKYHNFYLRSYSNITVVKPFTVTDDEAANRVVTVEQYLVPTLVSKGSKDARPAAYLYAPDMKVMLYRPDDTVRTTPYAVRHPEDLTVNIAATLPFAPTALAGARIVVNDPAFEFEGTTTFDALNLKLSYHYRSLADHVAPQNMETFIANLQQARSAVGYGLWANKPTPAAPSRNYLGIGIVLVGLLVAVQTMIAGLLVSIDSWKSKKGFKKRSIRTIVFTGASLLWGPAILTMLVAALLVVYASDSGNKAASDVKNGFYLLGVPIGLSFWWYAIWRSRWLRWADARAHDGARLTEEAKRYKLPHLLPSVVPTDTRISWLALIPQFALVALLIGLAHVVSAEHAVSLGAFAGYVVMIAFERFVPGNYRQGLRLLKAGHPAAAIPKFEASHEFFVKHPWVDRWRAITMLSLSRISFKEMALARTAFCLHQLGKVQEAIDCYERVLVLYPENALAETALKELRTSAAASLNGDTAVSLLRQQRFTN